MLYEYICVHDRFSITNAPDRKTVKMKMLYKGEISIILTILGFQQFNDFLAILNQCMPTGKLNALLMFPIFGIHSWYKSEISTGCQTIINKHYVRSCFETIIESVERSADSPDHDDCTL